MSTDSTRIHCTDCDYVYAEHYQPIELRCRTKSGVVSYYKALSWCYDCNKITYAEKLPDIETVRSDYEDWLGNQRAGLIMRVLSRFDRQYQEKLKFFHNRIAWREARTTPPHCLECGSKNLSILSFQAGSDHTAIAKGFQHSCGGILVHDHHDKTGIRYNFAKTVIWMDQQGSKR